MNFSFYKYQGTGNDFIIADNRDNSVGRLETGVVAKLCDRRFGIGADGLILLEEEEGHDFKMVYYNSDGNESSMCGNGGRCLVKFAARMGLVKGKVVFSASDGPHEAFIDEQGWVSLKMKDVLEVVHNVDGQSCFLDTGSPHFVMNVNDLASYDVFGEGQRIRNSEPFAAEGTNVNFTEKIGGELWVRTYERGVEDETFSCGTGVTAAAIANFSASGNPGINEAVVCRIQTLGGGLRVRFIPRPEKIFTDIWLEGPAELVFQGMIVI